MTKTAGASLPTVGDELQFVSVVVPVYNGRATIGRCIEALLAQDYPGDRREIIVVDNNSTDGTPDIVRRYPVHLVYEREIQTSYAARNRGIGHAQGEIVAFTDADCLPQPDWVSRLARCFADPSVVGAAGVIQPEATSGLVSGFLAEVNPVRSREVNGLWYVVTANAAYRREALVAAGGFRAQFFTAGDIELSTRLQLEGCGRIAAAPDAVVVHAYEDSWRELWARFRRYGYSEVLMSHLLRDRPDYRVKRTNQVRQIGRQLRALLTYGQSFVWRLRRVPQHGWVPQYNLWPLLWATAEVASIWGKFRACQATWKHP